MLIVKDAKIDEQTDEINQLQADMQKNARATNPIVNQNEDIKTQNTDLSQQVAGISVQNKMLEYKVDSLVEHLYERNLNFLKRTINQPFY